MTAFVATSVSIALDTTELAGYVNKLDLNATAEAKPWDNFGGGGWKSFAPGLMMVTLEATGFNDFGSTGLDAAVPLTGFGGSSVYCVSVPGTTAADPAFFGQGVRSSQLPAGFKIGEVSDWSLGLSGNGRMVRGSLLHPSAARAASGTGTAVAFTAPTATQSLYASFHVLSVTGAGTLTLKVQTDDNSGFATPTDRITSTAFAAVGSQQTSLAGALAGETHMRATWTVAGFTSVTFIVAAGVTTT